MADDDKIGSVCDLDKDFRVSSIPSAVLPSTGMDGFEVVDGDEQDTRSGAAPIERDDETCECPRLLILLLGSFVSGSRSGLDVAALGLEILRKLEAVAIPAARSTTGMEE